MLYTLPKLPYPFDALEPHIDAKTMEIHHDKHHAAYVTNLNKALEGTRPGPAAGRGAACATSTRVPEDIRTAVRNNGGGHANHSLFWTIMLGQAAAASRAELGRRDQKDFGGFDPFKERCTKAGVGPLRQRLGLAGLGQPRGKLLIDQHANQDSPYGRARRRSSASTSGSTPTT